MKNLEKVSLALGLLALLVSWIFKDAWIGHARPLGFTSLYICPYWDFWEFLPLSGIKT